MLNEIDYQRGQRQVWLNILRQAVNALGYEEGEALAWILEREQAIAMLRTLCAEHGDNDWPDDLHLADVIDKHLGRYLEGDHE